MNYFAKTMKAEEVTDEESRELINLSLTQEKEA